MRPYKRSANKQSVIANLHNKRPERRAPIVARLFPRGNASLGERVANIDIFDQPFTSSSYRPSFTYGVLDAACDLSVFQHVVINHNFDVQERSVQDNLNDRIQQYRSLQDWQDRLPLHLRNEGNNTPGTAFLR